MSDPLWEVRATVKNRFGTESVETSVRAVTKDEAEKLARKSATSFGKVTEVHVVESPHEMSDDELIGYCEIHCKTERALFHVSHVERIYKLAGRQSPLSLPAFVSVGPDTMLPLVALARKRPNAWDRVSEGLDGMRPTAWERVLKGEGDE